jgi:hypothetical protein
MPKLPKIAESGVYLTTFNFGLFGNSGDFGDSEGPVFIFGEIANGERDYKKRLFVNSTSAPSLARAAPVSIE